MGRIRRTPHSLMRQIAAIAKRFCGRTIWPGLACWLVLALASTAAIAQVDTPALESTEAIAGIGAADLASRIAVIETRTDLSTTERELVLEQLRAAASRAEAAEVARRSAAEYAAGLQSAPETIAALSAQSAMPPQRDALPEDADPVATQLRLAALQTESVSLHGRQRKLAEQLRAMESRPAEARAELGELRTQLDRAPTPVAATASPLLAEATRVRQEAAREELSARIEMIEQELSSLPTRKSIATAQHELVERRANEVDAAIEELDARLVSRRRQQVEADAARAREFELSLAGQPAEIRELARDSVALRTETSQLVQRLDRARDEQRRSRMLLDDAVEARRNADQILAIGALSDDAARLLRSLQTSLVSGEQIKRRMGERNRTLVDLRVRHFKTQQALRDLPASDGQWVSIATIDAREHLLEQLVEHRRAGVADMADVQQQLIDALSENNAIDAELLSASEQLHGVLDKRLLWLPSTAPLGDDWLQQLGVGVGWLLAPSNWSAMPRALLAALRAHPVRLLLMLLTVAALFGARGRLQAALPRLARSVGHRDDNFGTTLLAWAATFLLALAWPFAVATVGWFLGWSGGGFASFLGQGLLSLALLWLMLGLFIDMCRPKGLFVAHFHWGPQGTKRLARALRMLLLMIAPTAVLTGMTDASGDPELIDGIGRLGFMVGSLASAWFLYRLLRPSDGAPTTVRAPGAWIRRVSAGWARVLVAVPVVFAVLAAVGYYTSAREVQSRLFTSGWIILAVVIVYYIVIRGVMVASRRAAYLQADSVHARALAEARAAAGGEDGQDGSEVLALQNQQPEIDAVTVNQQTRALLRAAFGVALAVLIVGLWREMIPALNVFNDVVLWSRVVEGIGESVVAVTLSDVLISLLIVGLTAIAARNLPGFLEIMLLPSARVDSGTRYAIATIARYVITAIGLVIALQRIGLDWSKLQWVVAALGVGLGFGLQEIVANFVSGLIILFERPVRVGDVVTINHTTGTVSRIKMRSITITDFDNFEVLVPNKAFITDTVQNWTLTSPITRVVLKVGIGYGSDLRKARAVMESVAAADPKVLRSPAPDVLFTSLGDSALEFEVRFYVAQIDDRRAATHSLFVALTTALHEAGIEIPFPQRDVHVHHIGRVDAASGEAGEGDTPSS